ncbi:MAG: N-acetylmuramoyl-L-alanine amidase [Pseudomonadota bacterium]|jgi:N-acetylmuramoyl-L-alanine amidase
MHRTGIASQTLNFSAGLLLALAALLGAPPASAATLVTGAKLLPTGGGARFELALDGTPAAYQVFTLTGPARAVIDLTDARLSGPLRVPALDGTPVRAVRSGVRNGRDLRIVLDLSAPVAARGSTRAATGASPALLLLELSSPARPDPPPSARAGSPPPGRPAVTAATPPATPTSPPPAAGSDTRVPHGTAPVTPRSEPPPPAAAPDARLLRDIVIAIDAGHGGQDPGAIGPGGLREKQVVLAIARELKAAIDREPGYRAVLVRTGDYFIPLAQRPAIARRAGADVMLSIHADAFHRTAAQGASVYALSQRGATSETAKYLAERENRSDLIGGSVALYDKDPVLAEVILDLSMTATLTHSLHLGGQVLEAMGGVNRLHKRKVEQAGFVVLKSPDMPSILVETGFISNPQEARKLDDPGHRRRLAGAIFNGVKRHFAIHPPDGTRIAWQRRNGLGRTHVIDAGDTLSDIAQRYNVSVRQLQTHNGLDSAVIRVGQTLKIPGSS